MKIKIATLSYFFVALIASVCLYFVEGNVNLKLVSFFGETSSMLALLAVVAVPFLLMLFLFTFESSKKWICTVSSLLITAVYSMRVYASIKNMAYLKSQETLTTAKFVLYCSICVVLGALAIAFITLALSDSTKSYGTTILKVTSIIGLAAFSLLAIVFFIAIFIVSEDREKIRFFSTISIVFLMDAVNCLLMLLSVGGMRNSLYYRNQLQK